MAFARPGGRAAAEAPDYLRGLWTHLLYEDAPAEQRRLPLVYAGAYNVEEKFSEVIDAAKQNGTPLVLDIEKTQSRPSRPMMLDSTINTPSEVDRDREYMLAKLRRVKAAGLKVGLWSRPSQNGMGNIWKPGSARLRDHYRDRMREAGGVFSEQDFLVVQLYFPKQFERLTKGNRAVDQMIQRGEWFLREHAKHGKPSVLFVSPHWQGAGGRSVPAAWLKELVVHFIGRGESVCIWGGFKQRWDIDSPVCRAISELMTDYPNPAPSGARAAGRDAATP